METICKKVCDRCGKEIIETYRSEYFNCIRGQTWRTNIAFAKLGLWQPKQNKAEKPQVIALCSECYEEFVDFMEV